MMKLMLACCKLYISESRNAPALESIARVSKQYREAAIINTFQDEAYNRVGYTLVSHFTPSSSSMEVGPLRKAVVAMVKSAFDNINLEFHCGTHPRLGVVDHICFHPLAEASLDQVAGLAKLVAADIGYKLQVPTFLYGAAHEEGRTLDSIRRKMGYFKPNTAGNQWAGGPESESLPLQPDMGPIQASPKTGIVVVGATNWVDNYNVPVASRDIAAVRRIAKRVSGRGGGLTSVQAMALDHGKDSTEVACNLLNPHVIGADQVQLEIERLAKDEGMTVGKGYFTDLSQEEIVKNYMKLGFIF